MSPATASSSSSSPPLDAQSRDILQTLSAIPAKQLSILVLQQPQLTSFLTATLRKLVQRVLEQYAVPTDLDAFQAILRVLENAARSPDPTLPKRLLGGRVESIVDFTVAAASVSGATQPTLAKSLHKVMAKLVDPVAANKYIEAGAVACQAELDSGNATTQSRSARIVAAHLRLLPIAKPLANKQSGRFRPAPDASQPGDDDAAAMLAGVLAATHKSLDVAWNGTQAATAKVAVIDAATALLIRLVRSGSPSALATAVTALEDGSPGTSPSSSASSSSTSAVRQTVRPLVDASILADICAASNTQLADSIATVLREKSSTEEQEQVRATAVAALDRARKAAADLLPLSSSQSRTDLASLGSAWADVVEHYKDLSLRAARRAEKGRASASFEPPASLVAMIEAILPHLAADPTRLRRILSRRRFADKSDEQVIQLLLDDEGSASESDEDLPEPPIPEPIATSNIYQPAATPPPTNARANIFDEQPLDASRLQWTKAHKEDYSNSMPSMLKASILARVKAQDAEDEEAASQEWNPFADEERDARSRDVGFEEELEDGDDRINRRMAISYLGGERGNAGEWRRRLEDYEESGGDDADADADTGDDATRPSTPTTTATGGGAARERAAEKILILAYSHHGSALFTRDAAARKSPHRKALRAELEAATGRPYDDALVESWGTMFERNPHKDTLLNSASSYDFMAGGNPNRGAPAAAADHEGGAPSRRFGPDRGRGGRVMRGGGGGAGGRGGSNSGGGGGGNNSSTRGGAGHSGNNRGAKRKEQRGNVARTRGADRKARAMGGPGAGV